MDISNPDLPDLTPSEIKKPPETPEDKDGTMSKREKSLRIDRDEVHAFKRRLVHLRYAVVYAAVCHVLVTIVVMTMGFSRGGVSPEGEQLFLSPSIVTFGFGCANTVVFALVEAWNTLYHTSPKREFPSWMWHNNSFLAAVGNVFFLSLFMLPALVIFMLHSHGLEFFHVLASSKESRLFELVVFHLVTGLCVFLVDAFTLYKQTKTLGTFQQRADKEEEEKENAVEEVEDDLDGDDEDELRPITAGDRRLAWIALLVYLFFAIDLGLIATSIMPLHEGTTISFIFFVLLVLVWIYFTAKHRNLKEISENMLLNWRLATICHLFLFLGFFWLCLAILLFEETLSLGFFHTIKQLPSIRVFQCVVLMTLFALYLACYFVILYIHSRSMRSLDEIASLFLAQKLRARLIQDS